MYSYYIPQVDAIHTDAQGGISAGSFTLVGHMDFFPNGGVAVQPGCGELY